MQNLLSAPGSNKGKTKRERISQETIVTDRVSRLVCQTKITHGDLLKRLHVSGYSRALVIITQVVFTFPIFQLCFI